MGMVGVRKLFTPKIFKNDCKREGDLWRSYEDACKQEKDFLTELGKFLESYEKSLIQIKRIRMENNAGGNGHEYRRILEELNSLIHSCHSVHDHNSADQRLLKKVGCLITQLEQLHDELTDQKEKHANKFHCPRGWRRCLRMVICILFIGAAAAEFACTVVVAFMAPLVALAIAAAIIPTLAGQHWILSWIPEIEIPFEYPDNVIRLMESGTMTTFKELGDIRVDICLVAKSIEPVLSHLKSPTEGEADLNISNIEGFLKKINDLKERTWSCNSNIVKAMAGVCKVINDSKST